jgi:hypothetical protein
MSARKATAAVVFAVLVGFGMWWLLHSETDHGRGDARALAEALASNAKAADAPTPRRRDKPDAVAAPEDVAADASSAPRPARLTVRVVSVDDGSPVAGALVLALAGLSHDDPLAKGTTDASGVARLKIARRLNAGGQVFVSAPGFVRKACDPPECADGGDAELSLRLASAVALDGVAVDAVSGGPLAGARVVAFDVDDPKPGKGMHDQPYADVVTGADGTCRLDGVPPTKGANVLVTAPGRVPQESEWKIGAPRRLEFRLEPAGALRGVVRDVDGRAVVGAVVLAWCTEGTRHRATTGADGAYEIADLEFDVAHDVWAMSGSPATRASAAAHDVRVTSVAPSRTLDLVFARPARISVRVRDEGGASVFDADSSTIVEFSGWIRQSESLDHAGDATIQVLQPGRCNFAVSSPSFLRYESQLDVAAGDDRTLDIVLDRGAEVTGVVVGEDGAPIGRWGVGARRSDGRAERDQWNVCGEDGTFRLSGCVEGVDYDVAVWGDAYMKVERVKAPKSGVRLVVHARGTLRFQLVGLADVGEDVPRARLSFARDEAGRPSRDSELVVVVRDGADEHTVRAGTFDLTIGVEGYAPVTRHVELAADGDVDLGEIRIDRGVALTGRVVDRDGGPVADAAVSASVGAYDGGPFAQTDASGAFRLAHLPAGEIELRVCADGFEPATFRRATTQAPVELVLDN